MYVNIYRACEGTGEKFDTRKAKSRHQVTHARGVHFPICLSAKCDIQWMCTKPFCSNLYSFFDGPRQLATGRLLWAVTIAEAFGKAVDGFDPHPNQGKYNLYNARQYSYKFAQGDRRQAAFSWAKYICIYIYMYINKCI